MKKEHRVLALNAQKELKKALDSGKRSWANMAAIAIVFKKDVHISPNQACHAGLSNSYPGNKPNGALAVVSALTGRAKDTAKKKGSYKLPKEHQLKFMHWLLNDSAYSEVFSTKSAKKALSGRMVIVDAFKPSNLMAAALVATRRLWEYDHIARVTVDLMEEGVNGDLAFYLAHCSQASVSGTGNISFYAEHAGHCSLTPSVMDFKALKNFISHKVIRPNKTYNENYYYNYYDRMYTDKKYGEDDYWFKIPADVRVTTFIQNNFKPKANADKANPFAKAQDAKMISYADGIKAMAEFAKTVLMKEIDNA